MDEDLNSAQALALLFDLARDINRGRDGGEPIAAQQAVLRELAGVLGLTLAAPVAGAQEAAPFIDLLISLRTELRAAKQWALSDRIRDGLKELGVELKDSPQSTTWSVS
jgi:cysteinyl-tRNA synthetase